MSPSRRLSRRTVLAGLAERLQSGWGQSAMVKRANMRPE